MGEPSPFPSLHLRRFHLESATYRSIIHILSSLDGSSSLISSRKQPTPVSATRLAFAIPRDDGGALADGRTGGNSSETVAVTCQDENLQSRDELPKGEEVCCNSIERDASKGGMLEPIAEPGRDEDGDDVLEEGVSHHALQMGSDQGGLLGSSGECWLSGKEIRVELCQGSAMCAQHERRHDDDDVPQKGSYQSTPVTTEVKDKDSIYSVGVSEQEKGQECSHHTMLDMDNSDFDLHVNSRDESSLLKIQQEFSECIIADAPSVRNEIIDLQEVVSSPVDNFERKEQYGTDVRVSGCSHEELDSVSEGYLDSLQSIIHLEDDTRNEKETVECQALIVDASHSDAVVENDDLSGSKIELSAECMMPRDMIGTIGYCRDTNDGSIMSEGENFETIGKPEGVSNLVNDADLEEGEILNEVNESENCSGLDSKHAGVGAHKIVGQPLSLIAGGTENFEVHRHMSSTLRSNHLIEHELPLAKRYSRIANCSVLDYSDICGHDEALKNEKILEARQNKKDSVRVKKDDEKISSVNVSKLPGDFSENLQGPDEETQFSSEDVEVQAKKKKAPLSEGRKAKKKLSKKRKRADKNRKLGVKRLKLQTVSKPQKVTYCNFYLKGRCQQGDLCKFSHDTTPLTKSQPCKYFACQSCLKGSDCPFDHELWKYPCHNFMSTGACIRGDSCKFSHKIEVTKDCPSEMTASKFDSLKKPPASGKQLIASISSQAVNKSPGNTAFNSQNSIAKNPIERPALKIPKGMCFVSFAKNLPEDSPQTRNGSSSIKENNSHNVYNHAFDSRKNSDCIPLKHYFPGQDSKLSSAEFNPQAIAAKDTRTPETCSATATNKKMDINSICNNPATIHSSGDSQSDLSDATKLLEEFLFFGSTD